MRRSLPLLAVLLTSVVLSGCVSMEERIAQRRMYDESLSYAMNITRQFWTPRFRDTPVPKGVFVTNSTLGRDITLTTLSWATGPSSFLPGGFGLALGMDILGELGKETPPDMLPHILAYVDTDRFPSRRDAELEAVTQVFNAVKKGLADTGFKIAKETQPMRQKVLWTEISTAAADIENEAQGCALWSQFAGNTKGWRNKACGVGISIEQIDEDDLPAVKVPEWMANGGTAWPIVEGARINWYIPEHAKVDVDTLFAATAKHLPDNYWFYMEPRKKKGQKKRSAPYLLSNKGAHYFVEEQTEETKTK